MNKTTNKDQIECQNLMQDWEEARAQIPQIATENLELLKFFYMIYENSVSKTELLEAIQDLYYWQYPKYTDNFTSLLYSLFEKADRDNSLKLQKGFPAQAIAYNLWHTSINQDVFFEFFKNKGKSNE